MIGRVTFDPDKFGYYQSGQLKTYRKLEALEAHDRTGRFAEWNFNREIFDAVDWFTEPDLDLWSLYQSRCRQIRETYDYCVLFYSGGSDSDNILRAWISAGCRIDEIATIKLSSVNGEPGRFDWALEIPHVVEPMIDHLRCQGFEFQYREIDGVHHTWDFLNKNIHGYMYHASQSFSPNNLMKSCLREQIDDYRQMIDSGRRMCFVWGSDKPQIRYDQDRDQWFFDFVDIVDNCVSPYVQEKYHDGWFDELFYWTPDLPCMLVKQAHVLKRFCQTIMDPRHYQSAPTPYGYNNRLGQYLNVSTTKQLLYPHWNTDTLVAPKPQFGAVRQNFGYLVFSERDRWLFAGHEDLVKQYEEQVRSSVNFINRHSYPGWIPTPGNQSVWQHSRQSHRFA